MFQVCELADNQARLPAHLALEEWFWGQALLEPRDYTLVVQSGVNGYACYTKGNNLITSTTTSVQGYVEGLSNKNFTWLISNFI
jgi:hypothetical protein